MDGQCLVLSRLFLMDKPVVLAVHITFAVLALGLGSAVMLAPKGTARHRLIGRFWVAAMLAVAVSSLAFPAERLIMMGSLSALHLLSAATFVILPLAIRAARKKNIDLHKRLMLTLFSLLCITGVAAMFMPGRFLYRLFWG